MSLVLPYKRFTLAAPTVSGKLYRAKPIVPDTLVGPTNSFLRDCLGDTGSDDTVFPESLAALAGIDLTNAPTGTATGVGMVGAVLRYSLVTLRIASGTEQREWQGWVAFTATPLRRPLLGQMGFLEFFDAKFLSEREETVLEVNGNYSGS